MADDVIKGKSVSLSLPVSVKQALMANNGVVKATMLISAKEV